jgi:membrane-bound ClpP family serine protease
MCHITLLLPVLALPVFWILPLAVSVPVYAVVVIIAGLVYGYAMLAMRRPVETGVEGMIGATGEVVESHGASLVLRIGGEIWSGRSATALSKGERVEVIAMERLVLVVKRLDAPAPSSPDTRTPSPPHRVAGA